MARFIVIESLDGVGKTTLVRNLAAALGGIAMSMPGPAIKPLREQIHSVLGDARIAHALFYLAIAAAEGTRAGNARSRHSLATAAAQLPQGPAATRRSHGTDEPAAPVETGKAGRAP